MHTRRKLLEATQAAVTGIPGAKGPVRIAAPRLHGSPDNLPALFVHNVQSKVKPTAEGLPSPRPTYRAFQIMVAVVGTAAQEEAGLLDELSVEIERRVLNSPEITEIAKMHLSLLGDGYEHLPEMGGLVTGAHLFEFIALMTEGDPENHA